MASTKSDQTFMASLEGTQDILRVITTLPLTKKKVIVALFPYSLNILAFLH